MNKKVLTLCASFLLAGGLTSSALAETLLNAVDNQYYYVYLDRTGSAPSTSVDGTPSDASYGVLDVNTVTGGEQHSQEENRSTWWRVEKVIEKVNGVDQTVGYKLVNALTGEPLTVKANDKVYDTFDANGSQLYFGTTAASGEEVGYIGKSDAVSTSSAWGYTLYPVPAQQLSSAQINRVQNGFFGLQFGQIKDNEYVNYESLNGVDPFAGKLVAKNAPFGENVAGVNKQIKPDGYVSATQPGDNYFIYNETADAYVVLLKEKWSEYNTNLSPANIAGNGHRFALMTAKEIIEDQLQTDPKARKIATWSFRVNMPVVVDYSPLEVVAVNAWITSDKSEPTSPTKDQKDNLEMLISNMNGQNYLTTTKAEGNDKLDGDTDYTDNTLKDAVDPTNTVVRFSMTDYIDMSEFYGWAITIKGIEGEGVEGMTVRPNASNEVNIQPSDWWTRADYVSFSRPEAQWIVTVEDASIYLTNRETKVRTKWTEVFDMLTGTGLSLRHESGDTYVYQKNANTAYRFEIKKVAKLGGETWEHYGVYDEDQTEIGTTRTYKVTFNDAFGATTYLGIDGRGNVELTQDESAAINFDLVKTATTDTLNNDGTIAENAKDDIFRIVNNIMAQDKDGNWYYKAAGDTLLYYRYKLAYGDRFLKYNDATKDFELIDESVVYMDATVANKDVDYYNSDLADNYIVKLKENDKVNIINVINYEMENILSGKYSTNISNVKKTDNVIYELGSTTVPMFTEEAANAPAWPNSQEGEVLLANGEMMYFDMTNNKEAQQQQNIYNWAANAQLTIAPQTFNSYRYFATPDTMEFYRVEFDDEFLFERGKDGINFLGLTYDRKNYNPAIYVDTAYIQNTNKPTYLLAVAPEIEPSHKYCPTHGIDPDASVCVPEHQTTIPGYVTARYLVSFTDSVAAHAPELKNPYLEDGKYTKLGFVDAVHGVNDLNIIQNGDTVKTYELTDAVKKSSLNPVEFAFRIVDRTTEDFIIESTELKDGAYVTAYVRWQNGVPVLTQDITDAEVFNVRETALNPTANEEISAEASAISVIATDGAVIVKGAEGKNVIVSTILGKVVANETVNSDNETIAAPAGIVVVSVDGESFKVAVK